MANFAERMQVGDASGERMNPCRAEQSGTRGDRGGEFVGGDYTLARSDTTYADVKPLLQGHPRQDVGREVPLHDEGLVAGRPREGVGDQM
jgi:hypothetical protein